MRTINNILKKYNLVPHRYLKKNKAIFVDTNEGRYVIKKSSGNQDIKDYLISRKFNYYPQSKINEDGYEIVEYEEEFNIPKEQKIMDLIDLVSLLHSKTTHYKEMNEDDYKQIYEDINNNIEYLYSYYTDIITIIEGKVFPSPSEYEFSRNISKIYQSLNFVKRELDDWLELIKNKNKKRLVVIHNNLELDHFIRNNNSYLISWDKSRIDLPIFDLYKLYKRHALDFDFEELLKRYEHNYPLLEEEKKLFFILIALPDKIEFNKQEYLMTKEVTKFIDFIYKTENFISPYYSEK